MQIEVTRATLTAALTALSDVVDKKDVIPVLTHVLLEATGEVVRVSATNTQSAASAVLEGATATEPYACTVPHSALAAFARALPDGLMQLELTPPAVCRVVSGDASLRLAGLAPEDFPPMPSPQGSVESVVPAGHLREALRRLRKSTPGHDDSAGTASSARAGVRLHLLASAQVYAAAADTHRLTVIGAGPAAGVEATSVIVPVVAADALMRFLAPCDDEAPVSAYRDENRAWWVSGHRTFTTLLLDGKFPAVERVAAGAGGPAWFEVSRAAFDRALGRVSVVAEKTNTTVELKVDADILRVSMRTLRGDVVEHIRVSNRGTQAPSEMSFQHTYLAQMVDIFTGEQLRMEAKADNPMHAARFLSPDDTMPTAHVLMPMRGKAA